MNRLGFYLFLFVMLGVFQTAPAKIIVDCHQLDAQQVLSVVTQYSEYSVQGVILSHPFKKIGGNHDTSAMIYDSQDTGDKWQRGSLKTAMGNLQDYVNLLEYLRHKRIATYVLIDPYQQTDDFNRHIWNKTDFLPQEKSFPGLLLADLENGSAKSKLSDTFREISRIPADSFIVDIHRIPRDLQKKYTDFARGNLRGKCSIFSDTNTGFNPEVSSEFYWRLRQTTFLLPAGNLYTLTNIQVPRYLHYITSDNTTIANLATAFYLLSEEQDIIIPYSFWKSPPIARMMDFLKTAGEYHRDILSQNIMILYSPAKVMSFNMGSEPIVMKTPAYIAGTGFYPSIEGGAWLKSDGKNNRFFLLPQSVYVWKIGEKK